MSSGNQAARVAAVLENVQLAALQPVLTRFAPDLVVQCVANGELTADWNADGMAPAGSLQGNLQLHQLLVRSPEMIGTDEMRIEEVNSKLDLSLGSGRLQVAVMTLTSAVAAFDASGEISFPRLQQLLQQTTPASWKELAEAFAEDDWQARSNLDLSRLAALLPETLRIREGLSITSGTVRVAARSQQIDGRRIWTGQADATSLSATDGNQRLTWDRPVQAGVRIRREGGALVIDALQCRSDFLQLTGRGDASTATFDLNCDLDEFARELGRFVDLADIRIAGRLQGKATTEYAREQSSFRAHGAMQVEQFDLQLPGSLPWQEEELNVRFSAEGTGTPTGGLEQLETASLEVTERQDRFNISLLEPFRWQDSTAQARLSLALKGNLDRWTRRLRPFVPLEGLLAGGTADIRGNITLQPALAPVTVSFTDVTGDIASMKLHGYGLYLEDPQVRVVTSGTWNQETGVLASPLTTWASSAVSARADNLLVVLDGSPLPRISGAVAFRGGLDRLQAWFNPPSVPVTTRLEGLVNGQMQARHSGGMTRGRWDISIEKLGMLSLSDGVAARNPAAGAVPGGFPAQPVGYSRQWEPLWQETAPVRIRGEGSHETATGTIQLTSMEVTADAATLTASGSVAEMETRMLADLSGNISYDLAAISRRFPGLADSGVRIEGQQRRSFRLQGPLASATITTPAGISSGGPGGTRQYVSQQGHTVTGGISPDLHGQGSLGWASVSAWGVDVSGGELDGRLSSGVLQFEPLNLTVAGGKMQMTPRVELNGPEPIVHLAPGQILDNVQLTEEMCKGWLKFVAPMLADSARADGRFSASLSQAVIPASRPSSGDVDGVLSIHQAQVRPGPLASQLLSLTDTLKGIFDGKQRVDTGALGALTGLFGGGNTGAGQGAAATATGDNSRQLLVLPAQDVAFRLTQERIYHRLLQLQVDGVEVRTSGSVGLDQTLGLVAEIPVQDKWVSGKSWLESLKGQTLSIPIHGTLDKPQVDQRVLSDLASRVAGAAAGQFFEKNLGGGLKNQLEKTLGLPPSGSGPAGTPTPGTAAPANSPAGGLQQQLQNGLGRSLDGLFGPRSR
ncbi:MAG: hypothetical protein KDA79_03845 [Planctomycetaceae bacterium]|nr:hypothetical protein [Planctomycetaceae bacterium]